MEKRLSARDRWMIQRQFDPRNPGRLSVPPLPPASANQAPPRARDPVCGRLIGTAVEAGARVFVHKERLYFFCGTVCREQFMTMPDRYTSRRANGSRAGQRRRRAK
jgi:YHS domain-containing protein